MTLRRDGAWWLAAVVTVAAAISGCGLKGALTLPEKSGNVVVREQSAATGTGATGAPSNTAAPEAPTAEPAAAPLPEKMPPPELPRSNNGTSR